ncbi:MAG: helix-turn-helix domain-containing protein [Clostridia bacterium]|nr:helix-turn-helix domain-containing protein [Clostridia bacterium]
MAKSKWEQVKDKLILIEGWARDGLTNEQIASNLGISKTTFYKILNEHSELSELLKKGKEVVDYQVENALLKNALEGNTTAQIFWLKNRKPNKWKDKQDIDVSNNRMSLAEAIQKAYNNKVGDK